MELINYIAICFASITALCLFIAVLTVVTESVENRFGVVAGFFTGVLIMSILGGAFLYYGSKTIESTEIVHEDDKC